ncbi:hypothetical protein JIN84_15500 [Luteolibacter yonseiensis]|uniref:Uncharacterized protein n=1 Tax=Luteolibacter yonseiensis TaxID=1144680 RepID=A0A934VD01_9BACT|nr:hypothetical protein [Luteolibacter yonseiensis]MBK1817029.1 hypothetical protein [Luteolibacter yonseiensis]
MNASLASDPTIPSAHDLFPSSQAFLWLPGFAGEERAYCTYNEFRDTPLSVNQRRFHLLPEQDDNGAPYVPPFPVSRETHICWHTNVRPPYPYHPVPLARSLSPEEFADLGRKVTELAGENPAAYPDPVAVLRNQNKTYILAALAGMGLLSDRTVAFHRVA